MEKKIAPKMKVKKTAPKKIKKVNETEIVVVLDRSGSMGSIAKPTVDGLNSFINEQKKAKGKAFMTLVQFDNNYQVDYVSTPIKKVDNLILGKTYIPGATTALLDAVGKTINELKTERDVVFVIITDGQENASREFTREQIFQMIEDKKKKDWKFLFLAANQDAIATGAAFGISADNSVNWNANATSSKNMFASVSSKMSSYRSAKDFGDVDITTLSYSVSDREDLNK